MQTVTEFLNMCLCRPS